MIRNPLDRKTRILLGAVSIVVVVVLYACLSAMQQRKNPNDRTIPNLSQFVEGVQLIIAQDDDETLWDTWIVEDTVASLGRLALGMGVGVTLAFIVGIAMGCSSIAESLFLPSVAFFAKIPPTAMLPVYFVLVAIHRTPAAMIALGIFPTLAQSIHQAAKKDVTEHAIYKAYTLGATRMEVIWEVVIRQIMPRIIESTRLQVGPAMVFLIAVEYMIADVGFGYQLRIQQRQTHMNIVYTYLILLGVFGFFLDRLLTTFRRRLCPWFGE